MPTPTPSLVCTAKRKSRCKQLVIPIFGFQCCICNRRWCCILGFNLFVRQFHVHICNTEPSPNVRDVVRTLGCSSPVIPGNIHNCYEHCEGLITIKAACKTKAWKVYSACLIRLHMFRMHSYVVFC